MAAQCMALNAQAACTGPLTAHYCDGQAPVLINDGGTTRLAIYNSAGPIGGPYAPSSGSDVGITTSGNISTSSTVPDVSSTAIFVDQSAGGASSVISNGTLTAVGSAVSVRHYTNAFDARVTINGEATVSGLSGSARSDAVAVTHTGSGNIVIQTTAPITVGGAVSRAIGSYHVGTGNSTINVGANITSSGNGVFIGNTTDSGFNGVNSGPVDIGIAAGATVNAGLNGVFANTYGGKNITVNNAGTLTSGTTPSTAVINLQGNTTYTSGASERVVVNNTGSIIRKAQANAISATNGGLTLVNDGTIEGNILASRMVSVDNLINDDVTLNAGAVTGNIALYNGDDTGLWKGGTYTGQWQMGNGSDQLVVSASEIGTSNPVLDGGDDVSAADGMVDTLTVKDLAAPVTVSGGNWRNWETIVLTNADVSLSDGALTTGAEPNLGLFVGDGATLRAGAALNLMGNLTVQTGGSVAGTGAGVGQYQVSAAMAHAGVVALQDNAAGDRVTVAGDYAALGGRLLIDTVLAADGAASDQLVVNGNLSLAGGPVVIDVKNAGGAGAATTGNGILLVTVQGASPAGAFVLSGSLQVGGFTYALVQVANNWYLQSSPTPLAPQTITFGTQPGQTYQSGATFGIASPATASSGLPVVYTSSTPSVCTVSGSTVTMVSAGMCTLTAAQPGDSQFFPAQSVSQTFVITSGAPEQVAPVPTFSVLGWLLATLGLGGVGALCARRRRY